MTDWTYILCFFLFICAYDRRLLALHMDIQFAYRKPGRYQVQMLSGNIETKYVAYGFFGERVIVAFATSAILRLFFFQLFLSLLSHGRGSKGRLIVWRFFEIYPGCVPNLSIFFPILSYPILFPPFPSNSGEEAKRQPGFKKPT